LNTRQKQLKSHLVGITKEKTQIIMVLVNDPQLVVSHPVKVKMVKTYLSVTVRILVKLLTESSLTTTQ
jgi:hypothetical protein